MGMVVEIIVFHFYKTMKLTAFQTGKYLKLKYECIMFCIMKIIIVIYFLIFTLYIDILIPYYKNVNILPVISVQPVVRFTVVGKGG